MRRKRLYFSLLAGLIVLGLDRLGGCLNQRDQGVDESWKIWEETRQSIPFEHTWWDETLDFGYRRAERQVRRHWSKQPLMQVSTQIQRERLVERVMGFGLAEEWFSSVHGYRRFTLEAVGARRGVKITWKSYWEFTAEPDYEWIIQESIVDVRDSAKPLQGIAAQSFQGSSRDLIRIIASFVQTIPYKIPSYWRKLPKGHRLCTFGIAVPVEVLFLGWGDCDSKSLLFASILANFPGQSVVFVSGDRHLFAGVQTAPRPGDYYVKIQGIPYVLVELTTPWPVGRVHPQLWTQTKKGLYEIIPVVHPDVP